MIHPTQKNTDLVRPRRRASVLVPNGNKILGVKLRDPSSGETQIYLPGGRIEDGESPSDAAIRECREETGFDIAVPAGEGFWLRYDFLWNNVIHDCETWFTHGRLLGHHPKPVHDAPYNLGIEWIDLHQATSIFGFTPALRTAIAELLTLSRCR